MAVLDEPGEAHDTVEDLIKFYAKPLNGWSPAMLQNGWYAHMKYFLDVLGKAGVQFSKKADGTYLRTQGFGQPGRWWVHIANGMTIKRAMARIVRDAGINTLDNVMAVKILTDNGKACGAVSYTHLDVYKRQEDLHAKKLLALLAAMASAFSPATGCTLRSGDPEQ